MRHRCSRCGFTSETRSFFRREKGGLLQRLTTVCEACTAYQPTEYEHRAATRYFFAIGSVLVVCLLMLHNNPAFGAMVIAMTVTGALSLRLRIFIHEWGHALAARLVGTQVWQISVGTGPILRKRRFNGFTFDIHRYSFSGGKTWYAPLEGKRIGQRTAAILLGGAMANFLSAGLAISIAYALYRLHTFLLPLTVVPSGFALASVVTGVRSLLPQKYADPEPGFSDGMQLLRLFRYQPAHDRASIELRAIWLARTHRYEDILHTIGNNWHASHLRLFLASTLIDAVSRVRGNQAVIDLYKADPHQFDIPGEDEDSTAIAWTLGNIAWSALKLGREDLRPLADSLSARALERAPAASPIQATRAAWLITAGETEAGVNQLASAIRHLDSANDKAEFCAFLAQGLRRLGKHERAKGYEDLHHHLQGS